MTVRQRITIPIVLALLCALALVAGTVGRSHAAGSSHAHSLRHDPAPIAPAHYYVTAGWGNDDYAANIYTPRGLQIYAGDTVTWTVKGALEPHTISFGPLALLKRLSQNSVTPVPQKHAPPQLVFNPQVAFPTRSRAYAGTGFANSGLLQRGQTWTVTFSRPGVYTYYCLIHFPGMQGQVVVHPRPSSAGRFTVKSGYGSDTSAVDAFFPENLTIHVGNTVVWTPGFHTVSIAPLAVAQQLRRETIVAVPQAGGPPKLVFNPRIAFPTGGSTYNGSGFWNSGLLTSGPARVTFTKPGLYQYHCLIHPGMDGTIRVLP